MICLEKAILFLLRVINSSQLRNESQQVVRYHMIVENRSDNYVTLLLCRKTMDKKEGANFVFKIKLISALTREKLGVTGFDRLPIINTISQRDNCKLR